MKNNYKQLASKSPSEAAVFKRSASQSFRSSFRLTRRKHNAPTASSLPSYVPPKAAALLEISIPPATTFSENFNENLVRKGGEPLKVATIRRRSVWANSSASKIRDEVSQSDLMIDSNELLC